MPDYEMLIGAFISGGLTTLLVIYGLFGGIGNPWR